MSEVLKSLPNKRETSHETNLQKLGKIAIKAVKDFFNAENSVASEQVSETTATPAETKPYRHAPDLSRIEDGHTKEEMNKLQKKWEDWLNGGSVLSDNLENTLEAVYDDEKNNWGYDELDTFFENCKDIESDVKGRGTEDGITIADSINMAINILKRDFGRGSKEFTATAKGYVMNIQAGKFKGSRFPHDGSPDGEIIHASQYNKKLEDNTKRKGGQTSVEEFFMEK